MTNEEISLTIYSIIPEDQKRAVFGQERCEIEPEFLGFVKIYKNLSEIIPKHYTVIDFGCAYNPQSYLFIDHKRFIAVDEDPNTIPFKAQGTEFVNTSIDDFITNRLHEFDLDETFAICSYVPDEMAAEEIRHWFKNIFVFYPSKKNLKISSKGSRLTQSEAAALKNNWC